LIADTSVLVAISLAEEGSESLATALRSSRRAAIGAATLVESRIVLEGRLGDDGRRLLDAVLASGVIAVEPFTVTMPTSPSTGSVVTARGAIRHDSTWPTAWSTRPRRSPASRCSRSTTGSPSPTSSSSRSDGAYPVGVDADAVELRVLGCLLEKQRTTPDQYPLSLNALRLACNQTTNRDPVVAYDEHEIHEALQRLARRGWTRLASGAGSRAAKYRHLFDEALGLEDDETAVLCVLMLRGPQTPGELNQRTARLHAFAGLGEIHDTLARLASRELVRRLDRQPGQKEERYRHLLGPTEPEASGATAAPEAPGAAAAAPSELDARVRALEAEVARLRAIVDRLVPAERDG
jgi:uncharacterized protein